MIDKYEYIKGKQAILKSLEESGTVKDDALFWAGQMCGHIETISKLSLCQGFFDEWQLMLACKEQYDKIIYNRVSKEEVKTEKRRRKI